MTLLQVHVIGVAALWAAIVVLGLLGRRRGPARRGRRTAYTGAVQEGRLA